jgi:hypothetical protein
MKNLIEALQILNKYGNPSYPTHCEHDVLFVMIDPELVSDEDRTTLLKLGFIAGEGGGAEYFKSHRYGSA